MLKILYASFKKNSQTLTYLRLDVNMFDRHSFALRLTALLTELELYIEVVEVADFCRIIGIEDDICSRLYFLELRVLNLCEVSPTALAKATISV